MTKIATNKVDPAIPTGDGATLGRNRRLETRSGGDQTTMTSSRMIAELDRASHPARLTRWNRNHGHEADPATKTTLPLPAGNGTPIASGASRATRTKSQSHDRTGPRAIRMTGFAA